MSHELPGPFGELKNALSEITGLPVRVYEAPNYGSSDWSFVARGDSKYGFETRKDREQREIEALEREKKLAESETAKALEELGLGKTQEEEAQARELEAERLAPQLDPVIRDILTDYLLAYDIPQARVGWDDKASWKLQDGSQEERSIIEIKLDSDRKGIFLRLSSASPYGWGEDDGAAKATGESSIRRLVEVLEEFTQLPVRCDIFEEY